MKHFLYIIPVLVLTVCVAGADAKSKTKDEKPSYSVSVQSGISADYDDNVFRRTDDERDEFPTSVLEGKWNRIHTLDDLIIGQFIQLTYQRSNVRIRAKAKQTNYWQNSAKTFHYYGLNLRRTLAKRTYAYLDYRYVPRYYIRQIYDDDTRDHEAYDYKKHRLAAEFRKGFLKRGALAVFLHARYEHEDYNDNFNEYDFNAYAAEGEVSYDITREIEVGIGGLYREVHTKGYDEVGETFENNDDSDGSYEENTYELRLRYKLPLKFFGRTPSLSMGGSRNNKAYTTDLSPFDDPYHSGREDTKYAFTAGMSLSFKYGMSVGLKYKWQERKVDSYAKDDLGDEKDFTSNAIGMNVSFNLDMI